ncbi:MAG TPA: sugar ABC transporter permease [Acetobacteraceae bacterium]|nr:sugar ABC transporter permease [Acetobacteraceae bacterium]
MADGTTSVSAHALRGFAPPARRSGLQRFAQRRSTIAIVMCLPLIALIAGLVVYPFFYSIYLSMLNRTATRFIGLFNYRYLLRSDTFNLVIFQSCFFAITAVFFKALIGFILAHVMHNISGRDQRIWRGLLLVPWVIPPALSTLGFWWMLSGNYSAVNWILAQFGIHGVAWLANTWTARIWVVIVNVWFGTPFFMIMYLATLKSVPEQLYEAATIDGANFLQKIRYISLPMLRNIISITVLFSLIVTFANFDIVQILTAGAPANTTHVFATYAFQLGIQGGNISLGAAVSLFIFPILAVFSIFILRGVGRRAREGI